jgi:hypothetical protein
MCNSQTLKIERKEKKYKILKSEYSLFLPLFSSPRSSLLFPSLLFSSPLFSSLPLSSLLFPSLLFSSPLFSPLPPLFSPLPPLSPLFLALLSLMKLSALGVIFYMIIIFRK